MFCAAASTRRLVLAAYAVRLLVPARPLSASGSAPLRYSLRWCWRVRWGRARTGVQGWVTGNGFVATALLEPYVGDTRKVFDRMPVLDVVS